MSGWVSLYQDVRLVHVFQICPDYARLRHVMPVWTRLRQDWLG